ncbi:hypothetical protein G3I15_54780, partial [Streptomyces sp. SID10244]|nr:hypothetical protein [Streptomyces sp. SID10244]
MNLNRLLAIAVMVIASMGIATGATGAADAAPAAAKASTQWNVIRHGASVVVSTDNGSFAKVNNQLVLHDA